MTRYAAEVSYDGSKFSGWQVQPEQQTVQESIEKALSLLNGAHTPAAGAGRTDAGVHAKGQVCSFDMKKEWEPRRLLLAVNANLPEGVSFIRTAKVPQDFHARFSAVQREYRYFIWNSSSIYPHLKGRVCWLKAGGYDWKAAAEAASFLRGTHDFKNFCHLEGKEHSTVRTVSDIKLTRRGPLAVFRIMGDGFLHNMVRIIMGNLEEAALGRIRPEEMLRLLGTDAARGDGGRTFPPEGLYLWKITYRGEIW